MEQSVHHRLSLPPWVELQRLQHGVFSTAFYAVLEGPPHNPWYSIVVVTTMEHAEGQEVQVVPVYNGEGAMGGVEENGRGGCLNRHHHH